VLTDQQLSLARQLDLVFREISDELAHMSSGCVFIQIRNDMIGKFGVRHEPLDTSSAEEVKKQKGLNEQQRYAFRKMAIRALEHKKNWTHGEIQFDFALKKGVLHTSVQFESNYNMANLLQGRTRN
jgi:hypothetical protein